MEEIEVRSKMGFRELHYKLLSNCVVLVWCFPKASFNLPPFYLGERSSSPSSTKNDCNSPCFKAEIYHRKKARQRLGTQAEPHRKWVHGNMHKVRDSPFVHGPNFHLISSKG